MDREIKFRAWDKQNETMLKWNRHIKNSFYEFIRHDQFILMQYTGMVGIVGREIYEGDVIKNRYDRYFLVEYDEQSARWVGKNNSGRVPLDDLLEATGQVVGNKFEDSELLEKVN